MCFSGVSYVVCVACHGLYVGFYGQLACDSAKKKNCREEFVLYNVKMV
jgi:hypothetical protein